jgi:hypothetical protein
MLILFLFWKAKVKASGQFAAYAREIPEKRKAAHPK